MCRGPGTFSNPALDLDAAVNWCTANVLYRHYVWLDVLQKTTVMPVQPVLQVLITSTLAGGAYVLNGLAVRRDVRRKWE
jgi:hypothetical protein